MTDIIENIDAIRSYVDGMDFDAFAADRKTLDATERCLERVIEAIVRIGPERMSIILAPLPVQAVRSMGNRLRHEYEMVSVTTVWTTVVEDLPPLRAARIAVLEADG